MTKTLKFSEAKVRDLPLPEKGLRDTYHDEEQPGLQVRVTASGVKTFSVFRRVRGGDPMRLTIGRWPDITVEKARAKAAETIAKLAISENPAEARRTTKEEMRLGELFDRYLADRIKAGKRSTDQIRAMWELYLGEMPKTERKKHGRERVKADCGVDWSRQRLSEITYQRVNTLHSRIIANGKATTANRVHELLRAMFGFAVKHRLATGNPADAVTPAPECDRSRFMQRDELPIFMAAIEEEHQPWRDFFQILLYVGYRRSAVAAMRWQDVDLEAGTWGVPGERAKNGDPIVLPVSGPAIEILRSRFNERGKERVWVFPGEGREGHIGTPKAAWARVLKRTNIPDLRVHDLRRTLGSWMANAGVPLQEIGRVLGHKDARSTQVYARLIVETATRAVSKAHDEMADAIKNPKVVALRRKS